MAKGKNCRILDSIWLYFSVVGFIGLQKSSFFMVCPEKSLQGSFLGKFVEIIAHGYDLFIAIYMARYFNFVHQDGYH